LGNYALELGRGCRQNRVAGCEIFDLGAGGIKIGETAIRNADAEIARENQVSDCHIHHGGRIFHSAIGVWIGQSPGNRIVHSHIHDFYYTGISIGWTWGYGRALATNNLVEFNHIHHIGVQSDGDGPILSDMGGIYTLGLHTGTVIRNNLWHDFAGFRYGGWGIYFDEGTTGILAENNVVYRSTHGGFHQHYGKENIVRNNIFAYARDHQIQRSRVEPHRSFTFERNIVLWRQGATLGGNFSDANFGMNRNLYWREGGGDILFAKLPFDAWQKNGKDMDSRIADPKFVDPQKDNFTLQPDSPAFELGFKAIDLQGVGVRR
jgi:parallel beta-helix repeat protein